MDGVTNDLGGSVTALDNPVNPGPTGSENTPAGGGAPAGVPPLSPESSGAAAGSGSPLTGGEDARPDEGAKAPDGAPGDGVDRLAALVSRLEAGLAGVEATLAALQRQMALVPGKLKSLEDKVNGAATTLAEPRVRSLLQDVLRLHDLVDVMTRSAMPAANDDGAAVVRRNYEVLRSQLAQTLQQNGLLPIPTTGAFDPLLQQALSTVATEDAALDGTVARAVRPGFRTAAGSVLRYAEVEVYAVRKA